MADVLRLNRHDDDDGEYEPSDSEDDYSENERMLLEKVRSGRRRPQESDDEVFGIHSSNESDDGQEDMESDLEGQEEGDGLPDPKAWGKKRKNFYHTDYVDADYGGYQGKDAEEAEYEEQEARAIQQRLAQQLDEEDFSLDIFVKAPVPKEEEKNAEIIKTDLTKLSRRQKLALLERESPEFFSLIQDVKVKMTELRDKLEPVMTLIREDKIPSSPACDFVRTKYLLILNYSTNIAFYLLLKARRITVQSHPIVRRLFQYRQLLKQLEEVDTVIAPQIDAILEAIHAGEELVVIHGGKTKETSKAPKKKKLLNQLPTQDVEPDSSSDTNEESPVLKKPKQSITNLPSSIPQEESNILNGKAEEAAVSKRAITYQIAKNKGLTPRRKKEQRNPRVKHRKKFLKAKIRRKGQVREPRKELQKYGGEISGIKVGVTKSIKLK